MTKKLSEKRLSELKNKYSEDTIEAVFAVMQAFEDDRLEAEAFDKSINEILDKTEAQ